MDSNAYILLEAEEENWGLHCYGEWETIKWQIYSNGYCKLTIYYAHAQDEIIKPRVFHATLDYKRMIELSELLQREWISTCNQYDICDGTAWRIRHLSPSGQAIKHTGREARYIHGEEVIEILVDWLYLITKVDLNIDVQMLSTN